MFHHLLVEHLDRYLTDQISLRDLETFVLSHLQEILDSGDATAVELANRIDADLVELGEDLATEVALREHFETYLRQRETVSVASYEVIRSESSLTASSTDTLRAQYQSPTQVTNLDLGRVVFA